MKATFLRTMALVVMASAAIGGRAGTVDMTDIPMGNSIDPAVKPNMMFILDRSGSMSWSHMPDRPLSSFGGRVGYRSAQCNGVYYDPTIAYVVPVKADGTSYPPANFNSAWSDGFNTGLGTVDLRTQFRAYADGSSGTFNTLAGSGMGGLDTAQAAYYYQYNGAGGTGGTKQPGMSYTFDPTTGAVITTTTFYAECNATLASATIGAAANHTWTKVIVGAADEQNFANWYSYYRIRINMMKSATGLALKELNNPNFARLGLVYHDFASFTAIADYSDTTGVTNTCPGTTQRAKLYCALYSAVASGGTPTRTALSRVGRIYAHTLGGYADPVQFKCQKNAAILATDGFWNGDACGQNMAGACVGDQDGNIATSPRPYFGAGNTQDSMADIAMYYYKTHIRAALDNPPPAATDLPIAACPQVAKEGWVRQTAKDCATYLHMNTYTLGLGGSGSFNYVYGYETPGTSADYDAIVAGTKDWPDPTDTEDVHRMDDLWHAAVNGRGLYFGARTAEDVAEGLKRALAGGANTGGGTGPAPSGSMTLQAGGAVYRSEFKTEEWVGELGKYLFADEKKGIVSPVADWTAQALLDARTGENSDSRTIYMASGASLVPFDFGNLATARANKWFDAGPTNPNGALEQYQFFTAAQIAAATPASLIEYIRGWRGLEDFIIINGVREPRNNTTITDVTKLYRARTHVLGDIVNSPPVYIKESLFDYLDSGYETFKTNMKSREGVVYVGANDGMLHVFDAASGQEKWAFVPTAVMPNLYKLADKNYNVKHRYYVNGWITIADVNFGGGGSDWHTVLIGGLGKGGRAYYALDVTDPNSPQMLWEFASAASATATGTFDADMGYTPDGAQVHKFDGGPNSGKWAAAFASGYNNTGPGDGQGRLYVLDVKTGVKMEEIVTAGGSDPLLSGIGWVQGWTIDEMKDSSVKHVYSGDLGGRVWRFDIVGQTATLLTTLGGAASIQPVTSRVALGTFANDENQRVVYVGTGRYLGYCDIDPTPYPIPCPAGSTYYPINALQSLYAIRDSGTVPRSNVGNPYFKSVAIKLATGDRSGTMTYNNVTTNSYGWYWDFPAQAGERITVKPELLDNNTLAVLTNVPASDKCAVGGTGWVYVLETQSASAHNAEAANTWISLGSTMGAGITVLTAQSGQRIVEVGTTAGGIQTIPLNIPSYGNSVRRVSWRELAN